MDIKIDGSGDIVIENGDMVLVDSVEAVAQHVTINLQMFLGEWFLDTRVGVPYYQELLGQKPRLAAVRELFRDAILATAGMERINDLDVGYDTVTRVISVSFKGTSTSGTFDYSKEFVVP